ncbi:MAG: right-handed parallel beta-helix repeat-containing protein [Deltaproteobacteria bacterium]
MNYTVPYCPEFYHDIDIEIPVIVHALFNDEFENVSYAEVVEMIERVNQQLVTDPVTYKDHDPFVNIKKYNVNIRLKLIEQDECVNPTPGFKRYYSQKPWIYSDTLDGFLSEDLRIKENLIWNPLFCLNIFLVRSIEAKLINKCDEEQMVQINGYTIGDDDLSDYYSRDGIVLDDDYLYVLIHELGHYLGLNEIWQGECFKWYDCQEGDQVVDTEPVVDQLTINDGDNKRCNDQDYLIPANMCSEWIIGFNDEQNIEFNDVLCDSWYNQYGNGAIYQYPADNFMTYQWNCMTNFTDGQYRRMINNLEGNRPFLNEDNVFIDFSENTNHQIYELLNKTGTRINEFCNLKIRNFIKLGGNLVIDSGPDETICLKNFSFNMSNNAKISISNNTTVILDNTHIFNCDGFWDKIYVESGSTLIVKNNCLIENAKSAIEVEKGATVDISDCIFKNNFYSIVLNIKGEGETANLSAKNVKFYSDETFNYSYLGHNYERPMAGIAIYGHNYIDLTTPENNKNIYKRLSNGIIAFNSKINVTNSQFEDIYPGGYNFFNGSIIFDQGYAINFKGGPAISNVENSTIENCKYGIGLYKTNSNIISNTIDDVNNGIIIYDADHFDISGNQIEASDRGIYIAYSSPHSIFEQQYSMNISHNQNIKLTGNDESGKAIQFVNCADINIDNNIFEINDNEAGISLINCKDIEFLDNDVWITENSIDNTNCVNIDDCYHLKFVNNLLLDPYLTQSNSGFNVMNSLLNHYECNNIYSEKGIQFWDNCDNSSLIANKYYANSKDLVLGSPNAIGDAASSTWIGPQGNIQTKEGNGNLWPTQNSYAHNSSLGNIVLWSPFFVNAPVNTDYIPDIIEAADQWFRNDDSFSNLNPCSGVPGADLILPCNYLITKIKTIDTMRRIDPCRKLMWQYKYYLQLLKMKKAGQLSDQCLGFLNAQSNNVLVKIAKINMGVDSIGNLSLSTATALNTVFTLTMALDSLENIGQTGTQLWQRTVDQYNSTINQYITLKQRDEMRDSTMTDSLHTAINGVYLSDTCLATLLKVFGVKLRLMQADTLNQRDLTLIAHIADACPTELGEGVFLARSIMSLYENRRYMRMEDCIDGSLIPRNDAGIIKTEEKLSVFPNPVGREVTFSVNTDIEEKGILKIMDTNGQIVAQFEINNGKNSIVYIASSLKNGIYIVEYSSEKGAKKELQKLMIIK